MDTHGILTDFKKKISEDIRIEPEGLRRYRIITPFAYGDGDHFIIYLKILDRDNTILSDEGHTYMHMRYQDTNFWEGPRGELLEQLKSEFSINENDGKLELAIPNKQYGDALFSYIQAIQRITDIEFLSREMVRSTFMSDFREFISATLKPSDKLTFDYHDEVRDPEGKYTVDAHFKNGRAYHFYGISNDDKCKDSTINIRAFREWYPKGRPIPVAICQNQTSLNSMVFARLTDVCYKSYSSLSAAHDDLQIYLEEEDALKE